MIAKVIRVYGRVQGVFFRASTKEKAETLGIKGWVRNESNGTVLIHATGDKQSMDKFIKWCHQGPLMSHVEKVEMENLENGSFPDFQVTY